MSILKEKKEGHDLSLLKFFSSFSLINNYTKKAHNLLAFEVPTNCFFPYRVAHFRF